MPDNGVFYQLAYATAAAIYATYAFTIYWRWKRVRSRKTVRTAD